MEEVSAKQTITTPPLTGKQSDDRIYIMDRRTENEKAPQTTEQTAVSRTHTHHRIKRPSMRYNRLLMYSIAAIIGIVVGAVAAYISPISAESFSHSLVMSEKGGFSGMLLRRMLQCCAFLAIEYIVGYFAAGGLLVWIAPLVYALGTGLSAASAVMLSGDMSAVIFSVFYTAVLTCGANASGEFSSLLLRLVSGRSGSIVTDGAAAYHYTLRFCLYLGLLLFFALIEAWIRAVRA